MGFVGAPGCAHRHAETVLNSFKLGRGKWKPIYAEDGGYQVQFFLSEDKNKRQIRTEVAAKKMRLLLEERFPQQKFYIQKKIGDQCHCLLQH
eukprot:2662521-Karenia_brevis.AAC.1